MIATALSVAFFVPAQAQNVLCNDHDKITKHLEEQYKEAPIGLGIASDGILVEIWRSVDGKTWSMIMTRPNGKTCLVGAGKDWIEFPFQLRGVQL